ncbi:flavin reductase domain-containing protein [Bacillus freudenreichii]|nr:flavin reductase domain-containing protein [Bacillus freudenreichii]
MDQTDFRKTLGHFATGITVITTMDEKKQAIGLTANAFSSVSLDPPLILVCIDKKSESLQAFKEEAPFVVNILQENQEEACWSFAKKGDDKFEGIPHQRMEDGTPYLEGNLATIHCTVYENINAGDHIIVTGLVHDVSFNEEESPLLFFRGKVQNLQLSHNS